jgi:GT2 family glycosyltransferase
MSESPVVSVVLGTFERLGFLKLAIESVRKEISGIPHEIIVVDGGSADGTTRWLAAQRDIVTIIQHNRGEWRGTPIERKSWGYFMNLAFRSGRGKYICMVSDDCLVVPGAIRNGIERFERRLDEGEKLGALAFYWRNWPEQKRYWVGTAIGGRIFVNHGLYLRTALEEVGFIDAETFRFYHADADLALRLWQAGYVCEDSPDSFVEHYSHANVQVRKTNFERERSDWDAYVDKWTGVLTGPGEDARGKWIEKDFVDPANTAQQFWPLHRGRAMSRGLIERVKAVLLAVGLLDFARRIRGASSS